MGQPITPANVNDRRFPLCLPCAVAFAMALGSASATPLLYEIKSLGVLPGDVASSGSGINIRGEVAGESFALGNRNRAVRYMDGIGMQDLGLLPGYTVSAGSDINNFGQVVGFVSNDERNRAFRYTDGVGMQDLGVLPGDRGSLASAINNLGQVVGTSDRAEGEVGRAFRYTEGIGMQDLGVLLPGYVHTQAVGINDLGQVVGFGRSPSSPFRDFRYTDGIGMQDLGALPGDSSSRAGDINNRGQVVGISNGIFIPYRAFRYTDGVGMEDLGALPGPAAFAKINAAGDAIFNSHELNTRRPFLYTDALGTLVDLNTLLPSGSRWVLTFAGDINDRGEITGQGLLNGEYRAFVLSPVSPVPELNTTALVAIGLLAIAGVKTLKRRQLQSEHRHPDSTRKA